MLELGVFYRAGRYPFLITTENHYSGRVRFPGGGEEIPRQSSFTTQLPITSHEYLSLLRPYEYHDRAYH
jgi:hypothetical protein